MGETIRGSGILVVIFMRAVNCSTVDQIRVTGNRWTTNERRALLSTRAALFSIARNPKIASPLRWLMYRIPAHPSNSIHYRRPRIFPLFSLQFFRPIHDRNFISIVYEFRSVCANGKYGKRTDENGINLFIGFVWYTRIKNNTFWYFSRYPFAETWKLYQKFYFTLLYDV